MIVYNEALLYIFCQLKKHLIKFWNSFSDQRIINHEKDFVLVCPNNKCIIVIEAKSTLGAGDSIDKSMDQLLNTKADLESYFTSDIMKENPWMSSEWVFVPMLYCEEIEQDVKISQTCVDFVIQGKYFYSLTQYCIFTTIEL